MTETVDNRLPVAGLLCRSRRTVCAEGLAVRPRLRFDLPRWLALVCLALSLAGCTSPFEYVRNGFKVGPNYSPPPGPVAPHWIDAADQRVRSDCGELDQWWLVFHDPVLTNLIQCANRQNLTLREAGFRILEARAQKNIAAGELFPQSQTVNGDYMRRGVSENVANRIATPTRWFSQWDLGFNLSWELDFWGRFRRAMEAADAELGASVESYNDVLVTLLADVGTNYVQIRTLEKRLDLALASVQLFQVVLAVPEARYRADAKNRVSYDLARANLAQAQALVPQLEIARRQAQNRLCILLGMPPRDLQQELGIGLIPVPPFQVAAGIPASLLGRRPDVRRAEREAAAQSARIGIAEADFYPQIAINGTFGWSSEHVTNLFAPESLRGAFTPNFNWNILNYGRIQNNVRFHDARFQELVTQYQQTVLKASGEVENGLISFLKSQQRAQALAASADAWRDGTGILVAQYKAEMIDFVPVGYFQQNLLQQQDEATQAEGDVPLALIEVYRALGGGWQIWQGGGTPVTAAAGPAMPSSPAPAPPQVPKELMPLPKP
jgi:NodT family efflux transporter outer membrane factor (OMF) lipoprotein